jgi:hypothetical protein
MRGKVEESKKLAYTEQRPKAQKLHNPFHAKEPPRSCENPLRLCFTAGSSFALRALRIRRKAGPARAAEVSAPGRDRRPSEVESTVRPEGISLHI